MKTGAKYLANISNHIKNPSIDIFTKCHVAANSNCVVGFGVCTNNTSTKKLNGRGLEPLKVLL